MATPRHGYPLGALFLFVAACGVLTAIVTPFGRAVIANKISVWELVLSIVGGVAVASLLGMFIGLFSHRIGRGIGLGALSGALVGLIAGPLVLVPASAFVEVLIAAVGGSILLLVVAAFLRLTSGNES